jgi:hypothetical protein
MTDRACVPLPFPPDRIVWNHDRIVESDREGNQYRAKNWAHYESIPLRENSVDDRPIGDR